MPSPRKKKGQKKIQIAARRMNTNMLRDWRRDVFEKNRRRAAEVWSMRDTKGETCSAVEP